MKLAKKLHKALDLKLYTLSTDELRVYITKKLKKAKVKPTEYMGNFYSIRFPGHPIFVAHMDTVRDSDMKLPLHYTDGKLSRVGGILGADDRAGINMILNHCSKINFIITHGEESGLIGATQLAKHENFMELITNGSCLIELDRRGTNEVLASNHGYCGEDLYEAISGVFPNIENAYGAYTDIDAFNDDMPSMNLCVGYFNQHTNSEYLVVDAWSYINAKIMEIHRSLTDPYLAPPYKASSPYGGYWQGVDDYDDDDYNDDGYQSLASNWYGRQTEPQVCSWCGEDGDYLPVHHIKTVNKCICEDCMNDVVEAYYEKGGV